MVVLGLVGSRIGHSRNGRVRNGRSRIGRSRNGTSTLLPMGGGPIGPPLFQRQISQKTLKC
jgi:hypothetical protein